jgi:C-methyltransferase-like protein/putative zinc binding protein/methyltransferase family protein
MIDQDVKPGRLDRCQITGSSELNLVIDLGHQPPCDSLLTAEMLNQPEKTYPLRLMHCPESGLAQLDYVVDGSEIYYPDYPYRSGISRPLEVYQRAFADGIVKRFAISAGALCVDIGSNDGTLLTGFKRHGCRALGVEPTNIARIARSENDIETIQQFFTEALAHDIVRDYGRARVITMTNVFAHMASLGEVMRGLVQLLDGDGVFVTESHYLLDVLEKNQFDTVYHEHIRTYSLKSLLRLFSDYGMEVFDVERAERYGGNIRAYVARKGLYPVSAAVGELRELEDRVGLHTQEAWNQFRRRVLDNRDRFMEFMYQARRQGRSLIGNSCPGRASTLLNYYGVTPDLMPYIGELPTSLKLGLYLPGKHIPVVKNTRIVEEQPDYLVLLSWHYMEPIVQRLRSEGVKSRLVTPLPEFKMLDL